MRHEDGSQEGTYGWVDPNGVLRYLLSTKNLLHFSNGSRAEKTLWSLEEISGALLICLINMGKYVCHKGVVPYPRYIIM